MNPATQKVQTQFEDNMKISAVVSTHEKEILSEWMAQQNAAIGSRKNVISEAELKDQSAKFLREFSNGAEKGSFENVQSQEWAGVREVLETLSRARAKQGFSPTETATFVFSLKQPLFTAIRKDMGKDADALAAALWSATMLLDKLGLFTMEVYLKGREEVIQSQQEAMLELSTPVVTLWDGILALPMIGTLDSARTQVVMETLLQEIVDTGATIAIIDITGVPTVDTLVAQHLLKTVAAARLMGADCIISGIRPQIAQTIVHLGVELNDVITKATLADALKIALSRLNLMVTKKAA